MMKSEFEDLVGYSVSDREYKAIEMLYMASILDKQEFCKSWNTSADLKNFASLLISKNDEIDSTIMVYEEDVRSSHEEIFELKKKIHFLEGWEPAGIRSHMSGDDYAKLCSMKDAKILSAKEAVDFVHKTLGFKREDIIIKKLVPVYEVSKMLNLVRDYDTIARDPVYVSKNKNYVYFEVNGDFWEYVNGEMILQGN